MQEINQTPSVAVITGATKGMGKGIAEKCLKEGLDIAICSRTFKDLKKQKTAWEIQFPKRKIYIQKVDVMKKEEVVDFAKKILEVFSRIDILVNNAGLFQPGNLMEEQEDHLEKMMKTNLYSAYYLTRVLLPNMLKNKKGHIFNLCSVASLKAYPNGGSYSISKFALLGFTENLRFELKEQNIKVTAITPGAVWTDSWNESGFPESRMIEVNDIAELFWAAYNLSAQSVVENIVIRPQLGDI